MGSDATWLADMWARPPVRRRERPLLPSQQSPWSKLCHVCPCRCIKALGDLQVDSVILPDGEAHKSMDVLQKVTDTAAHPPTPVCSDGTPHARMRPWGLVSAPFT